MDVFGPPFPSAVGVGLGVQTGALVPMGPHIVTRRGRVACAIPPPPPVTTR